MDVRMKEGSAKRSDSMAIKVRRMEAELDLAASEEQPIRVRQSELTIPSLPTDPAKIAAADELAGKKEELVRLALEQFEIKCKQHVEGELPFADVIEACDALENAEIRAGNPARPLGAIKESSLKRIQALEKAATELHKAGSLSEADLKGIKLRRLQAEIDLKTPDHEKLDAPAILRRLNELEKKVQELEKRLPPRGVGGSR